MRALVIVTTLALLAALAAACSEAQPATTPPTEVALALTVTPSPTPVPTPVPTATPTATPTPIPSPTPTLPSPQAILESSFDAMEKVVSFHYEVELQMEMEIPGGGVIREQLIAFVGDFLTPDRSHSTVSMVMTSEFEVITIGGTTYFTNETGEWAVIPTGEDHSVLPLDVRWLLEIGQSGIEGPALLGEETINEVTTYHLKGTGEIQSGYLASGLLGNRFDAQLEVWVGLSDNRIRQFVAEGEIETPEGENTGTVVMTVKLSDFDKPVVIQAPEVTLAALAEALDDALEDAEIPEPDFEELRTFFASLPADVKAELRNDGWTDERTHAFLSEDYEPTLGEFQSLMTPLAETPIPPLAPVTTAWIVELPSFILEPAVVEIGEEAVEELRSGRAPTGSEFLALIGVLPIEP